MSTAEPRPESRFVDLVRTFCALPMFLIITVLFWLLALHAWLLSEWCDVSGWSVLGVLPRVVALLLAALTTIGTGLFLVTWIGEMVRVIRGRGEVTEQPEGEKCSSTPDPASG